MIEFGRNPVRERSNESRDLRLVIDTTTKPKNKLDRREKVWRFEREEMEEGIGPKKDLSERSR